MPSDESQFVEVRLALWVQVDPKDDTLIETSGDSAEPASAAQPGEAEAHAVTESEAGDSAQPLSESEPELTPNPASELDAQPESLPDPEPDSEETDDDDEEDDDKDDDDWDDDEDDDD